MNADILAYNVSQPDKEKKICDLLAMEIDVELNGAENKLWHKHPVWFIDGNPIVGYSVQKAGVRLLFWSGQSFDETLLKKEGSFKAAEMLYNNPDEISMTDLKRWLTKSRTIQWDYKNLVKRKGRLEKLNF